jgi:hypothetical protein
MKRDVQGDVITSSKVLSGWHINYQGELPEGREQFAVQVKRPARQWL